ncbi:MAG: hypothetical protein COA44_09480 [Arcobacter sp.]|nr:MAG: hypothetical protein COA44_09480 [Arcobacter sp.]
MPKKHIVVEKGVVLCEHGGQAELISSVPNHVIAGDKPLYTDDFLGAVINGCTNNISVGGQCTSVASITSAITESNVSNKGKNYLLRTDGCQTDKGAALILVDPGQTNSIVPVKQTGASNLAVIKALEDAELNTKENILKEKYRIYPLRKSNKESRGLRGLRDFRVMKNYHYANGYTHERIVPKTEAYIYMTIDGITKEYQVINRGDYFRPQIEQVYFKDEDKILRRYLPVYEEGKKPELVYSNIKLVKPYTDVSKLTTKVVDFTDKSLSYVTHHKVFSKAVRHEQKEFEKEKLISIDEAKKLNKKYLNVVVHLEDLIGEVEDLYHDMESSFYRAYAHNKDFIDKVKERNAYAYSVAHFMDEVELNSKEKTNRDATKKKLKEAYYTLVKGLKETYLPYIMDTCRTRNYTWTIKNSQSTFVRMNAFVEHDVAMSYLQQMKTNASFLLSPMHVPISRREHHKYEYYNTFDGERLTHLKEECIREKHTTDYLCIGKKAFNYNVDKEILESVQGSSYQGEKQNHAHTMALLVSSLYFSGKHDKVIDSKYKDAIEDFHYSLQQLGAHPEFGEDVQKEINEKFKNSAYTKLFDYTNTTPSDTFIEDYEDLETVAKSCAFEWEGNDKTQLLKFTTLIPKDESFDFYFKKKTTTPKQYGEQLNKKLQDSKLKTILEKYASILENTKDKDTILTVLSMGYMLSASRTMFDAEVSQTSPFNANSAIMEFLIFISKTLQKLEASEHEVLYQDEIFKQYHKSIHGLILHALVKGYFNKKDFSTRANNATKNFLDVLAPQTAKTSKLDLTNLNGGSIDKDLQVKQATDKLFEQLKAIDGIPSQIHSAEDAQAKKDKKKRPGSKKNDHKIGLTNLRNSDHYKITIPALKGLSFLVALYQTGKIAKDYPKMTFNSLLELSASINILAKVTGEAAQSSKLLSANARALTLFKAMQNEKLIFQRVLTKLAIPIVIFGGYHQIASLDDEDYDAVVAISLKTGLTIALMLYATGIGEILVIGIAIELIWMKLSGYFIDSKLEVMIEKSLFYQNGRKSYLLESLSNDTKEYLYKGSNKNIKDIVLTQKPKDVRDFIYVNYADHKKEINAAFNYEISSIYAALKGVNIETSTIPKNYKSSQGTYSICSYMSISKDFYKEITRIVLLEDGKEIELDINKHELHKGKEFIDLLTHILIKDKSVLLEHSKKDTKLLLHSDTISLKYDVIYFYDDVSNYTNRSEGGSLKIIDLKPIPLNKDDCEILNIEGS